MTNPVLDRELEELREEMGLRENQKAELLRELATMASWLFAQARAGRIIEARGPDGAEVFRHPAIRGPVLSRVVLSAGEADRLVALLDAEAAPSPALQETLNRLAGTTGAPAVTWKTG